MRDRLRDLLDALRHLLRGLRDLVRAALDLLQQRAQMLRHRMERCREMADFVVRLDFERRLAQVAIRNALGRRFEAAQRMHDEVREAERRKEDQNERHDEADNQRDADVVRTREHLRAVHNRQILVACLVRRIDADEFRRTVEVDFLQALLAEVERGKLAEVCFAELREILVRVLRVSDDDAVLVEHHEIARLANLDLADAVRHDRQVDVEAEHAARLAAVTLDDGENADGRRAFRRLERIRDADSVRVLHAVREPVALARIIARLALDSRILQVAAVHRAIAHDGDRALVRLAEALEQCIRLRLETALRGRLHRNHAVAAGRARRSIEILRDVAALLQHGVIRHVDEAVAQAGQERVHRRVHLLRLQLRICCKCVHLRIRDDLVEHESQHDQHDDENGRDTDHNLLLDAETSQEIFHSLPLPFSFHRVVF